MMPRNLKGWIILVVAILVAVWVYNRFIRAKVAGA